MNDRTAFPTMADVLARIVAVQEHTAPVTLTIGGVSDAGKVLHNVIIISDAPPAVVQDIVTYYQFVSVTPQGLRIPCTETGKD